MLLLWVVRILLLVGFFSKNLPMQWLTHYAWGKGRDKEVPSHLISQVEDTFHLAIERGMVDGDSIFIHHSTLYEGSGFNNRPELFYLVGGFTATYQEGTVVFQDVYDWHPTSEGDWFTSSFNIPVWGHKLLNRVFGEKYYPLSGFPSGNSGFSNKLWADLEKVGAKSFTSFGKCEMDLSSTCKKVEERRVRRMEMEKEAEELDFS